MNDLVSLMKTNGTAIDPTLGIFLDMFLNEPGKFLVSHAASHMGVDQSLGSITPGKRAHFVLVDGNPLDDIGALVRARIVVKDQFMYSTADLLREQGYLPFD